MTVSVVLMSKYDCGTAYDDISSPKASEFVVCNYRGVKRISSLNSEEKRLVYILGTRVKKISD